MFVYLFVFLEFWVLVVFVFCFFGKVEELFLIDNTNRPLMKEQIVDCGEETQKTDVGYSRTKTKVETEGSQKNKKEKD